MHKSLLLSVLALGISCAPSPVSPGTPRAHATRQEAKMASPPMPPVSSPPSSRDRTISATMTGILVDGRPACTAEVTLVGGYSEGCAPAVVSTNELENALEDRNDDPLQEPSTWLLELARELPLVAFHQVVTTLYRANILDFTIDYGGKRRTVTNRRDESNLVLRFHANNTFRAGIESGSLQLGPSCPRSYATLDHALERCLEEVARANMVVFIDVDAAPSVPGETRTVGFLWGILERIRGDLAVAIL